MIPANILAARIDSVLDIKLALSIEKLFKITTIDLGKIVVQEINSKLNNVPEFKLKKENLVKQEDVVDSVKTGWEID